VSSNLHDSQYGLVDVAQAIRRHAALTVAMSITPAESSIEDMLGTADTLMEWLEKDPIPAPVAPDFSAWSGSP